jgi:hypothetical protein
MTNYIQLLAIYVLFIPNVSTYNDIVIKTHLLMDGKFSGRAIRVGWATERRALEDSNM